MKNFFLAVALSIFSITASAVTGASNKNAANSAPKVVTHKPVVAQQPALQPPSQASLGFFKAATNGNYDMMELFLQQGADINCLNCVTSYSYNQMTALFRALLKGYEADYQLADWLIQKGADINIPASGGGVTGVSLVMNTAGNGDLPSLAALDYLAKRGADFKSIDSNGNSALHYIRGWNLIGGRDDYSSKVVAAIDQLIQNGANVNVQDKSGTTVLMQAAVSCSPAAIKLLLSYGADPVLVDKLGKSALDSAIEQATTSRQNSGCNEVVKILNNAQQIPRSPVVRSGNVDRLIVATTGSQGSVSYAGTYAGTFNGSDTGTFQVTVLPNGTLNLNGYSSKGDVFTGEGKANADGSVAIGSASTGATFTGVIRSGAIEGNWKNTTYNQAGSFQGKIGAEFVKIQPPPVNPISGFFNALNQILPPKR